MSLLTDKEIREALKPVGITPGNVLYEASRAIESAVMAKLWEQKPTIYQWTLKQDRFTQYTHTHLPNDQAEFYGWYVKPLFEHPAPSAPEGWTLMPNNLTDAIYKAMLDSQGPVEVTYKAMLIAARSE